MSDPLAYIRALRRRWATVVGAVLVSFVAGWLVTAPGAAADPTVEVAAGPQQYLATTYILQTGPGPIGNLSTLTTLATIGEVPRRVAEALGVEHPIQLRSQVSVAADKDSGLLTIGVTNEDGDQAVRIADTYAKELLGWLAEGPEEEAQAETERLLASVEPLEAEIVALDEQLREAGESERLILQAERDAKVQQYQAAQSRLQSLLSRPPASSGLTVVEAAQAVPVAPPDSGRAPVVPASRPVRLAIAVLLGLVLGIALALLVDRVDTRLRDRREVGRRFGLPVIGEIPRLRRSAGLDDAFHVLVAGLKRHLDRPAEGGAQVILVTSPGEEAGKTTVVWGLAEARADLGDQVLVLSCDFRAPKILAHHEYEPSIGLSDALSGENGTRVLTDDHVLRIEDLPLWVVPPGTRLEHPARLLGSDRMRRTIEEARSEVDVIILDSPPLLSVSDAAYLAPYADLVLVVARAKRTTAEEATRTSDMLELLEVPKAAVVLNDVGGGPEGGAGTGTRPGTRGEPRLSRPTVRA